MIKKPAIQMIMSVIQDVTNKPVSISEDTKLVDSGLSSLQLAIVVIKLKDFFGADPFENLTIWPVTFKDFVDLYEFVNS